MDTQLCNGFQAAHIFHLSRKFDNCCEPKIVFYKQAQVLFKLKAQ